MLNLHNPRQNHLLDALLKAEYNRICIGLELVHMPLGQVLYEPGGLLKYVYFPTTSIVSLLYVMENGASAEIAVVGNEGILGVSIFMGGDTTPSRAVVQSDGYGYRLKAQLMKMNLTAQGQCCAYYYATHKHSSHKCHKRQCAIATIQLSSNYAAGYC